MKKILIKRYFLRIDDVKYGPNDVVEVSDELAANLVKEGDATIIDAYGGVKEPNITSGKGDDPNQADNADEEDITEDDLNPEEVLSDIDLGGKVK